jgi:hypothetical protein
MTKDDFEEMIDKIHDKAKNFLALKLLTIKFIVLYILVTTIYVVSQYIFAEEN